MGGKKKTLGFLLNIYNSMFSGGSHLLFYHQVVNYRYFNTLHKELQMSSQSPSKRKKKLSVMKIAVFVTNFACSLSRTKF